MALHEGEFELRDKIKELIRGKKFDELESLWLSVVEGQPLSVMLHEAIARYLLNRGELGRMGEMYSLLLSTRNETGQQQQVIDIARALLDIEPGLVFLRQHIIQAYKGMHSDRPEERIEQFVEISALDEGQDLVRAMAKFEDLIGASKGQVFKHNQWGLGVVLELDAQEGWAIVDFPKKPNHRMTIEGIKNYLQRIPHDHVYARIAKDKETYRGEVFEDPAAVVRQVLKNYGGKLKAGDMKKVLTGGFLSDNEYKRWWAKAKDAVRLDPYVDTSGKGTGMELILRREPRSFVDEISVRMIEAKSLEERRTALRDVDRHGNDADMSEEDMDVLTGLFMKPFVDGTIESPEEKFGNGVLFEEFRSLFKEDAENPINIDEYLKGDPYEVGDLIASLKVFELKRIALDRVLESREEDAPQIFEHAFFDADSRLVSWMEKKLAATGSHDVMEHCIERILAHPTRNVDLFVWAGRKAIDGQFPHITESIKPVVICEAGVRALNDIEDEISGADDKEEKALQTRAAKVRSLLQDSQMKSVKTALSTASIDESRRFLTAVNMARGLSNQLRTALEQLVYTEQPDLKKKAPSEQLEEQAKPSYHYSTPDAIERKRQELSHILNVEIPENSVAIGTARELGDLKENAEYHAAKDRQKLLMQQASEIEELISRARPIDLDQVRTDEVRFGTTVRLKNIDSGDLEECTLMGMWEANAEKKIISYMTPFGSQVMNRKPGEEFRISFPDGRTVNYRIESVEKAANLAGKV